MARKSKKTASKSTINVKALCKQHTDLNISAAYMSELVTFLDDTVIPLMVRMSETSAKGDGRKTLMEQDYLSMKDYVWYYLSTLSKHFGGT